MGLRALFFLVTGLLDRQVYLSIGLALILAFISVKLILEWGHGVDTRVPEISTAASLAVTAVVLAAATVASLARSRPRSRIPCPRRNRPRDPRDASDLAARLGVRRRTGSSEEGRP